MQRELDFVLEQFKDHFANRQGKQYAIYGLGPNTKAILDACGENCSIVALMDGTRTGETVWDLPVVTCDEARTLGAEAIIILARASNLSIIYRRIEEDCIRLGIPVYDINGRLIEEPDEEQRKRFLSFYAEHGYEQMKEKIEGCDVTSFDIFDTLLMRKMLYTEDIVALVEKRAFNQGWLKEGMPFAKQRQRVERELYLLGQPSLNDIYSTMVEQGHLEGEQARLLQKLEIETEMENILPRKAMVSLLQYAKKIGKTVCCTSDMYLPEETLREMLRKCSVGPVDKIFVSCETGCHKGNGLFAVLKEAYPGARILHIGDNEDADIKSAQRYGIEDVFPVHSALKMLEDSPVAGLLKYADSLENRLEIGRFLAKYLEDPFLFQRTKGRLEIKSAYDIGQDFLEPMMASFLDWMVERCEANGIEMLLLGARDGWMMTGLLDIYSQDRKLPFEYRYIPASRTACTVAGVKTAEDVAFAASSVFSGTAEEMLEKRFLLGRGEFLPRESQEDDKAYVMRHKQIILEKAKIYRRNYRKTMETFGIREGTKKAYFDFVSSGSCQLWLEKILGEKLKGYVYARFILPGKEQLDMEAFLAEVFPMQGEIGCRVLRNYLFVESLVSAPDPFLLNVEAGGNLRFDEEKRSEEMLDQIKAAQQGLAERYRVERDEVSVSRELGDFLAGMLQKEYSFLAEGNPRDCKLIDEFCNREFKMSSFFE